MDYTKVMARAPDEELFRIANPDIGEEYEADAIAAARAEISRRGISEEVGRDIQFEIGEQRLDESERPDEPLGKAGWILFMLIGPLLPISMAGVLYLKATGYKEKAADARGAVTGGIIIYLLLCFVFVVYALSVVGEPPR